MRKHSARYLLISFSQFQGFNPVARFFNCILTLLKLSLETFLAVLCIKFSCKKYKILFRYILVLDLNATENDDDALKSCLFLQSMAFKTFFIKLFLKSSLSNKTTILNLIFFFAFEERKTLETCKKRLHIRNILVYFEVIVSFFLRPVTSHRDELNLGLGQMRNPFYV